MVVCLLALLQVLFAAAASPVVTLHGTSIAQRYDGHGGLSAGASSRLLIDYPSPQREEILDILFKPKHGMSLHTLKVEIGGDTQSTDGTEPSHARSKAELADCNVERGYEAWLLQEAKKRNPEIVVSALAWGVPGWINSGEVAKPDYFNRDNIEYQVSWVKCVKEKLGISTDFLGIWNERPWGNTDYVTELRAALNNAGFNKATTGIVMLDGGLDKNFKHALLTNSTFADAVTAVGLHYPCNQPDTDIVNVAKKKYWASEDLSTPADWAGAGCWGRTLNSNFVRMNMTSTISWSLLWSVYPNLDCFGNGLMYAYEPWSGHYEVNPTVWTTAHTTQFARPGWHYLSAGPGGGSGVLPGGGGTYVTLRDTFDGSPSIFDWSLVVETLVGQCMYHDGCFHPGHWPTSKMVTFQLAQFGQQGDFFLHLWVTNASHQFLQLPDLEVIGDRFSLLVAPDSIYTVTTTNGQSKAGAPAKPPVSIPASSAFPLPFAENFEAYPVGSLAKFWSDQAGSFEIASSSMSSSENKVLRQVVLECPIQWAANPDPFTVVGGVNWTDYVVSVDVAFDGIVSGAVPSSGCGGADGTNSTYVSLCGRISAWKGFQGAPISGYCVRVAKSGEWTLSAGWPVVLAAGRWPSPARWLRLSLAFSGPSVVALIDGHVVAEVFSTAYSLGLAALSSGWHGASFDNFVADVAKPMPPVDKGLVTAVRSLAFDYSKRTCDPHPESITKLRNDFSGKVGLAFTVAAGQHVKVTTLLRYMPDGNVGHHTLELFEFLHEDFVSIANVSLDMQHSATLALDALGFAAAPLPEPVLLKAGGRYILASSEVAGGDTWMDTVPIEVAQSSPFEVSGNVYQEVGAGSVWHTLKIGSFSYGPVSLYFVTADGAQPSESFFM